MITNYTPASFSLYLPPLAPAVCCEEDELGRLILIFILSLFFFGGLTKAFLAPLLINRFFGTSFQFKKLRMIFKTLVANVIECIFLSILAGVLRVLIVFFLSREFLKVISPKVETFVYTSFFILSAFIFSTLIEWTIFAAFFVKSEIREIYFLKVSFILNLFAYFVSLLFLLLFLFLLP